MALCFDGSWLCEVVCCFQDRLAHAACIAALIATSETGRSQELVTPLGLGLFLLAELPLCIGTLAKGLGAWH